MGINRTHSFGHSSAMLMLVCAALLLLSVLTGKGLAQGNESPKRGLQAGGAYSLGDIETINQTNGNLMLHLPLASLPAGRGGQSAGLQLLYNSKLYESRVEVVPDHIRPGQWISQNWLFKSDAGGWRYGVGYDLELENRLDQFQNPVPSCTVFRPDTDGTTIGGSSDTRVIYIFKLKMTFPDGSAHEFRPHGHNDDRGDGYFKVRPDGLINGCPNTSQTYNRLTYYSVDGTYLRLDFQPAPGVVWHQTPWTLYYPDGTRVTSREQGALGQRVYDRNNNYIEIQRVTLPNGNPATKLVDQLGRSIMVEFDSPLNQDYIRMTGAGGQDVTWTVKWKTAYVNKTYYTTPQGSLYPQTIRANWRVVDQIILPAQAGALDYTFNYNAAPYDPGTSENVTSYGWGEISSITLPSGAQAAYQYALDGVSGPSTLGNPSYKHVLHNSPTRKDLTYQQEYDGASTPVSETWQYDFGDPFASGFTTSIIIGPDNGLTMVTFGDTSSSSWTSGLVKKIAHPDGRVVEQIWQQNKVDPLRDANPYVKTEATSIRDAGGNLAKTAIKDYNYDKNGNVTQVAEYDWVSYSSAHDASGNLIIPQNAPLKRVIVNSYYSPTPDASDTTTNDPDAYNKPTSPNLKNAIEFSEARSDFSAGSVISRAESFYDNPSTTGNLTTERKWDSIKAGISRPLSAGNSISVTHQYDPYGNRTLTTDANGVQTQFIYDPINGHGNLYVTETKVAVGTPVQQMTTRAYDFHTGLVTQSTDADNNVTNRTTYDVFGRPILVEEADGIAGVEKQTATEHSDTERRVIVRSDLNTTGDGKLITIQHYDQLGRICLTRRLESGNPAEATDKTKGVKIQTRYFAGDAGNPNGYELVSAPYRAATSGAAGGEPGMAWKRTKFDEGGRFIEVETFVGATPPAPWGGNSISSGKLTTEYDAEFTTVTDQAGKKRRSRVDALGRLVRVDEPDAVGNLGGTSAPVQPTNYAYNALDNLIQTSQTGVPNGGSSPVTQIRTFTLSSLGRLITANNPESGPISHEYYANGNLKKKTDARNVFINYTYDELNRNRTVDYSDTTVNPDITREYDNPAAGEYGKGRLWRSYAGGNESAGQNVEKQEVMGYDALGRAKSVRQSFKNNSVWSAAFTTSQIYDLAGHVKTKTFPTGRSVTYTYDVAGDLTGFTGNLGDGVSRTYSTGIQYNPQGQLIREQFGTSMPLYHRRHYNSRGQLFDVRLGTDGGAINDGPNPAQWTGASWNRGALRMFLSSNLIEYAWPAVAPQSNNGNLYRQDHFVPTALDGGGAVTGWVMSADYYCYDSLNRVAQTAEETYTSAGVYTPNVFNQQFSYDRFGNRLVSSAFGTGVPNPGFKINGANNRLIAPTDADGSQASDKMQYDLSGNLIKDTHTQTGTAGNRIYDAENRMLTADGANGLANRYVYDADGHRTRRSLNNGGEVWWQVYGIGGELVGEYQLVSGAPTLRKEYGYRNGQLLVVWDGSETGDRQLQWLVPDHLGSTRIAVDRSGSLGGVKRHDFLPFGEELSAGVGIRSAAIGYGSDSTRQKFTSKERDDETGLDYFLARYYSSAQGRFISPDEFPGGPTELFAEVAAHNPTFYADIAEPQSLNKYSYCLNNPLKFVDPDGHQATMADAIKLGAAAGAALEAVPGGQAVGTGVLVVTGVAALGYAAYNTDWKALWNGYVNSVARGFGGDSDRPGAYIAEKHHPLLKSESIEAEDVQPSKVPEATNAPALKGNPYSPQEVDKRRSDRRREMGTGNLDPNSPIPDQKPGKNIKGTHQADKKQHHATGERNVGTEEEHSRKAKGSHDLPRKP